NESALDVFQEALLVGLHNLLRGHPPQICPRQLRRLRAARLRANTEPLRILGALRLCELAGQLLNKTRNPVLTNGPVLNKPGNVEHFSDRAQVNARLGGGRLQLQLGPLVRDGLKSRSTAPLLSLQESTLLLRHLGLTKLLNFLGKPLPVVLV